MVPLIINPIYSLYIGFLSGTSPLKGVFGGLKQLGYHPKGTTIFPMIVSGRVNWILQILDVEMKELLEVSKNCTSSCWLAVLCPTSVIQKERNVRKTKIPTWYLKHPENVFVSVGFDSKSC